MFNIDGTADITLHEKLKGNNHKELIKAISSPCVVTSVDQRFYSLLTRIFGGSLLHELQTTKTYAYINLMNEFEAAKRKVKPSDGDDSRINITIPFLVMNELCQEHHDEGLLEVLGGSTLANDIKGICDKLRIKGSFFKSLFDDTIQEILNHINDILKEPEAKDVSRLLIVGGFSESPLIQDAIKKAFPQLRVIVPEDAGLVVLKGAVIYGHQPDFWRCS